MVEEKAKTIERIYTIPLRREFLKVPQYRRAGRAAKAVKQFIAKHMKVPERDVDKVKMDIYLNNELWFRGKANPPSRIKVKAKKEGDIVRVELVEIPEQAKFHKIKHEKFHKAEEKKEEKKPEVKEKVKEKAEEKKELEKKEEHKKDEKEKEKSVEKEQIKEAKKEKLASKHITKVKEAEIKRTSMNRH